MFNIFDDLKELNRPLFVEGDAPVELPNEFYTISEDYTGDNLNADNKPLEVLYEFTLKYYTKNPNAVYTGLNEAIALLKSKGYLISGVGYHSQSYKEWFSRMVDVNKIDYLERN